MLFMLTPLRLDIFANIIIPTPRVMRGVTVAARFIIDDASALLRDGLFLRFVNAADTRR